MLKFLFSEIFFYHCCILLFSRFQHVFDQRVKQEDIFEMTAKPVIDR